MLIATSRHTGRRHGNRAQRRLQLPRSSMAVAHHQAPIVLVAPMSVSLEILGYFRCQRRVQHAPRPFADELLQGTLADQSCRNVSFVDVCFGWVELWHVVLLLSPSTLPRSARLIHNFGAYLAFVFARGHKEGGKEVEYSPTTRRNRRKQIGQLVQWGIAEGYLPGDFVGRIKAQLIGDEVGEIATLSPAESRVLFEAAREIAGGKLAP